MAVSASEGIWYGFRLLGYFIGVFIIGSIIVFMGVAMMESAGLRGEGRLFLGGLISLVGFATYFAGMLGIGYKVIADAVEKGMIASKNKYQ